MLKLVLITTAFVALCVVLLCFNILFKKNGTFPKTHVSSNKYLRRNGVSCAQSQDFAMRQKNIHAIKERKQ